MGGPLIEHNSGLQLRAAARVFLELEVIVEDVHVYVFHAHLLHELGGGKLG